MNPQSLEPEYLPFEAADAFLHPDRNFAVPGTGIRVSTVQAIPERSIKVRVALGSSGIPRRGAQGMSRPIRLVSGGSFGESIRTVW